MHKERCKQRYVSELQLYSHIYTHAYIRYYSSLCFCFVCVCPINANTTRLIAKKLSCLLSKTINKKKKTKNKQKHKCFALSSSLSLPLVLSPSQSLSLSSLSLSALNQLPLYFNKSLSAIAAQTKVSPNCCCC